MTIRREELKQFENSRTAENECDNRNEMPWVGYGKEQAHNRECSKMLEPNAGNLWAQASRRQCRKDNKGEAQPSCDRDKSAIHGHIAIRFN